MLYYLFNYLDEKMDLAGAGLFQFITFRSFLAVTTALAVALLFGKRMIRALQKLQLGESVRDLGLTGQSEKAGTPTMGGLIISFCILLPTLLFARLDNVYVILLLVSTLWMGLLGFLDDYIKVLKKNKKGLEGKFKVVGQIGLGLLVGLMLYFNDHVKVRKYEKEVHFNMELTNATGSYTDSKSTKTTVPFFKNNELDYSSIGEWGGIDFTWVVYVLVCIFVVTAVSNGANITDGIDGLAAGTSAIIGFTLAVLAYVSGHVIFSHYLNIMYIPFSGEIVIFCAAFVGACVGFRWFNAYPAQVFMGDTGSLMLGGLIAVIALSIRKELLIPIICGIFLIENLSVIIQVAYFKYTKRQHGEGQRIFLMSPLHHHYQKLGYHESKIVDRFMIVGLILSALTLATLKIR